MDTKSFMDFKVCTQYTLEEYKQFQQALLSKGAKLRPIMIIGFVILIGEDIFALFLGGMDLLFLLLPLTVCYVAFSFMMNRIWEKSAVKLWKSKSLTQDVLITFHFMPDRLEITYDSSDEVYTYDQFGKLVETDSHFYPMLTNNSGFIIRKDACTPEQQNWIREKCTGRRNPQQAGHTRSVECLPPERITDQNAEDAEKPLFLASTKYTLQRYLSFCFAVMLRNAGLYVIFGVILLMLGCYYYLQNGIYGLRSALIMAVLAIVAVFVMLLIVWLISWKSSTLVQNHEGKYRFYPDRVDVTGPFGKTCIPYHKLYQLVETKHHFYLMIARNQGFILCKSECSSELIDFLKGKKEKGL